MKYSKTALKELTARYRDILRKCAYLNAVVLAGLAITAPAMAERIIIDEATTLTGQTMSAIL